MVELYMWRHWPVFQAGVVLEAELGPPRVASGKPVLTQNEIHDPASEKVIGAVE
jgi:hypothetical protein